MEKITKTSNQVRKPPNPTGKGGFGDNPHLINKNGWSSEHSQKFWLHKFLAMSQKEFELWKKNNPPSKRTMAQNLAYRRIKDSEEKLEDYKVVADRTEGKPVQPIEADVTSNGEPLGVVVLPLRSTNEDTLGTTNKTD